MFLENVNLSSSTSDRFQLFGRAKQSLVPSCISNTKNRQLSLYTKTLFSLS